MPPSVERVCEMSIRRCTQTRYDPARQGIARTVVCHYQRNSCASGIDVLQVERVGQHLGRKKCSRIRRHSVASGLQRSRLSESVTWFATSAAIS